MPRGAGAEETGTSGSASVRTAAPEGRSSAGTLGFLEFGWIKAALFQMPQRSPIVPFPIYHSGRTAGRRRSASVPCCKTSAAGSAPALVISKGGGKNVPGERAFSLPSTALERDRGRKKIKISPTWGDLSVSRVVRGRPHAP